MMSGCFPGDKRTSAEPYASLDEMWGVLDQFTTSKVKADSGDAGSLPSMTGLSLYSNSGGGRSQGQTFSAPAQWNQQSTRGQQAARGKQQHVQDVFSVSYNCWPLATDEHWESVYYAVCQNYRTQLPPLWSPLLTSGADRAAAFADNVGKCLNCHGGDHSVRNCPQPFTNRSRMLNPQLGMLNDQDETFRKWQRRMLSRRTLVDNKPPFAGGQTQAFGTRSNSQSRGRGGRRRHYNSSAQNTFRPPQPDNAPFAQSAQAPAMTVYQPQLTMQPHRSGQAVPPASPIADNINGRNPGSYIGRNNRQN